MADILHPFVSQADKWLWGVLDASAKAPVAWLRERFPFAAQSLREGRFSRDAAIVPQSGAKSRLATVEIDGGSDAKFVVVYVREVPADWRPGLQETLVYGRGVAGTDLIYDLTGEFLQGKARPFLADFRELPLRVYAVLPFQVEQIDLAVQQRVELSANSNAGPNALPMRLRFLDGRGEPISARLPYCLGLRDPQGESTLHSYLSTHPEECFPKRFCAPFTSRDGHWTVSIRSLLTGDEATLPIEVARVADASNQRAESLSSNGFEVRRTPQPVKLAG